MPTRVLIVDDNEMYRAAFKRNLILNDYDVSEAEDGEKALAAFQLNRPDVVVTDLNMRTPTEGLDLIRGLKQADPLAPVIMISAVGTFEEGAEASRLGAHKVISKARIDEELGSLYKAIDEARQGADYARERRGEIEALLADRDKITREHAARLRQLAADARLHPLVRSEAYDALMIATEEETRRGMEEKLGGAREPDIAEADRSLEREIPEMKKFDPVSVKELRTAEYFFLRQGGDSPEGADFSRNIGFSYCFAVENEAKSRLRKKLHRFLSAGDTTKLIRRLMDARSGQLDLFYHQHLFRLQQQIAFDFTIDNVRQVFQRILEHEGRYKPDGLKALGILLVCFGRDYTIKTAKDTIRIANPLQLKGFETEAEIIRFAHLLVSLQHYRNPYIHPEISDMEKVSKIRDTAFACLREIAKAA